jgi:hypothetical protein
MNKKSFYIYSGVLFAVFILLATFSGLFKIGILSDTFGDAYTAVNSSVPDKISNNLQFIDEYRYRPVLFLSLQGIVNIQSLLDIPYDNFVFYKLVNLILYISFSFIAGLIVLKFTSSLKITLLAEAVVLIYPNNLHNLCWSAAYFEILCGIFFLVSILFVLKYIEEKKTILLATSLTAFILAMLTKEIAITIPVVCILLVYLAYGKKQLIENKIVFISQLIVLSLYFISKTFLNTGIPVISSKYFNGDFLINSILIILKGIIALVIPFDFTVMKIGIQEFNPLYIIYFLIIILFVIYLLYKIIKEKSFISVLIASLIFLVTISPYIYAGYIRPQLILLPFSILIISAVRIIKFRTNILKCGAGIIFISWLFIGYGVIDGWKQAYTEGKQRIDNILKTEFSKEKKNIVIGNPARVQQFFMFDNIMFPYNYFKYGKFVLNDTLSDLIRTVALDRESLNSRINVAGISNTEFELTCTGKTQFFYLDGNEYDIKKNKGIKNDFMSAEYTEYNKFGKPVKIILKILSDKVDCYIFQGSKLEKLN